MSGARRLVWRVLGLSATGLGMAGILLPLLPTTPFLLLAAICFSRSSPRLHTWLVDHPRLGPPIRDWQAHGAIGRRAKLAAATAMLATLALSVWFGVAGPVLAVQALCLAGAAIFVLSRPDPPSGR